MVKSGIPHGMSLATPEVPIDKAEEKTRGTAAVWMRRVGAVFAVVFALWLLSPMLTSCYVEAYVARLQSMALLQHQHLLAMDDQAYPIDTEMLYVTRRGMVWLMEGAMLVLHSTGIQVLRVLTIASFLLLSGSCIAFARRWAKAPLWAAVAAIVATPGIVEPSFFIADNLVSAALATLALALVGRSLTLPRWFFIGILVACALLVRMDAVLIIPALLAVLWLSSRDYRRMAFALVLAAVGAAAVLYAASSHGLSLTTAWKVARLFSFMNNNPEIYQTGLLKTRALIFFGFFGLISLPLVILNAWRSWAQRGWEWGFVMTLLPACFYLLVISRANEIRDFCLLAAPFVVLHGACGWEWLRKSLLKQHSNRRWAAGTLLAFFALVLLAPPYISMRDGPRTLVGRAYSPVFWRQWQGRTTTMIHQIDTLIDNVQPTQTMLVLTSQFEPERYLHLSLLQDGFTLGKTSSSDSPCRSIEVFRKGTRAVFDLRTDNPYGLVHGASASTVIGEMQLDASLQCLRSISFTRAYFFSLGDSGKQYDPALHGEERPIPDHFFLPILHKASTGFFSSTPLSPTDVTLLDAASQRQVRQWQEGHSSPDLTDFFHHVQPRFWVPN